MTDNLVESMTVVLRATIAVQWVQPIDLYCVEGS